VTEHDPPGQIDISRVPASGIGGVGLLVMAAGIAWFLPELRWLAVIALVGGVAVGLTLIGVRNRRVRRTVTLLGVILAVAVAGFLLFLFFI